MISQNFMFKYPYRVGGIGFQDNLDHSDKLTRPNHWTIMLNPHDPVIG